MKVKKKRKEAEREGDASFITVSKCYLPAHSPVEDAFWGRRQLLSRDLPLQTLLKGMERARVQTGGREAVEGIWCSSFLQHGRCSALCLLTTGELHTPSLFGFCFCMWCTDSGQSWCISYLRCFHYLVCLLYFPYSVITWAKDTLLFPLNGM